MRQRKNKYSSLPSQPIKVLPPSGSSLVLRFKKVNGRSQEVNLLFFEDEPHPRPQLGRLCAEIFWLDMQDSAPDTREGTKYALKEFNKFLTWRVGEDLSRNITSFEEVSSSVLIEYQVYLATICKIIERTADGIYLRITAFLGRIKKHRPECLQSDLTIPGSRFSKFTRGPSSESLISLSDLRLIEAAAQKELNEIRDNHRYAITLLEESQGRLEHEPNNKKRKGHWKSIGNVIHYLVQERDITKPVSRSLEQTLKAHSFPTARKILGWYAPVSDSYFVPFLILLYIRTLINVTSIYTLKRNCLAELPVPLDVTAIRFTKPRAGTRSNQELYFPSGQHNGAVKLIKFLLEYTKPWVEFASHEEKDHLFLFRSKFEGIRAVGDQCGKNDLPLFIKRNNLPQFSFAQLRPTIATLIYLQTRDVFRVQRLLGHASVRTTIGYIRGVVVEAQHNQQMNDGIGQMIESITGITLNKGDVSVFHEPVDSVIAKKIAAEELTPEAGKRIRSGGCRTLIGRCKDPENSPQPGEIKGRICRSLNACLFCENCWIFVEDLPDLISYREDLIADKADLREEEWESLYGEAVREINEAILPAFPAAVIERAEMEARNNSIRQLDSWE